MPRLPCRSLRLALAGITLATGLVLSGRQQVAATATTAPLVPAHDLSTASVASTAQRQARAADDYGKLPLSFEPNAGQAAPGTDVLVHGSGLSAALSATQVQLVLRSPGGDADQKRPADLSASQPAMAAPPTALTLQLRGANPTAAVSLDEQLPGTVNYFSGNDPSRWHTAIPTYQRVTYHDAYPGIDLQYDGTQGTLEYTFLLQAGADPSAIVLQFDGADSLRIDGDGSLVIATAAGELRQPLPGVYQDVRGTRRTISAGYLLQDDGSVSFTLGAYDRGLPLVIDPGLVYSTFLGGSGGEVGRGIAVDSSGNVYVAGNSTSSNFPITTGAFQTTDQGGSDVLVTKLNSAGTALVYSTYLGGDGSDSGSAIAVDTGGNAYLTGSTNSSNFPTTAGAFQTTNQGGYAVFVTKLNGTGTALVYSAYLGGNVNDGGSGIAVDSSGSAYVTGEAGSTNFPITAGAFQTTKHNGAHDVFVTKLNSLGTALVYSTYLGGSGNDVGNAIAIDASGNAYLTGYTDSGNFPITAGAFQTTFQGGVYDAFVTKLNGTGTALAYSTYLGGSGEEQGNAIAVDGSGNAYLTGYTAYGSFPTTPGAYQTTNQGGYDAFVTKLNGTGTAPVYSTYLGGSSGDSGYGIAVDSSGNAYVIGSTSSTNFPTTPGAYQTSNQGSSDVFVTKMDSTGTALVYSTYLGGSNVDDGFAIAVDAGGNAYLTGRTGSSNFPITAGAFQTTFQGVDWHVFVTKLNIVQPPPCTTASLTPSLMSPQTVGTSITLTAAGTGCASYQFYLAPYGGSYGVVQSYSSSTTWTWNTSSYSAGLYYLLVYARAAGSTTPYDSYALITFNLANPGPQCPNVSLTPSLMSPQMVGTNITLTAAGSGCAQYQFYLAPSGGSYNLQQAYSSSASWSWNTSTYAAGTYFILVYAKAAGSASYYDSYTSISYALSTAGSTCTSAGLTASPASPQLVGTAVTAAASGSGCAQYQFYLAPSGGSYSLVQAYSSSASWLWNTGSSSAGTYFILVYAKAAGSTSYYDSYAVSSYALTTAGSTCTSATLTPSVASPQAAGTNISFTAAGTGCASFQFYLAPSGGSYSLVQPYSPTANWLWSTGTYSAGAYFILVYAKVAGSSSYYDSYAVVPYTIN